MTTTTSYHNQRVGEDLHQQWLDGLTLTDYRPIGSGGFGTVQLTPAEAATCAKCHGNDAPYEDLPASVYASEADRYYAWDNHSPGGEVAL